MSPADLFQVRIPDGYDTIEAWLVEYDARPRVLPYWPMSQRMTLVVCVLGRGPDGRLKDTRAYVLTSKDEVDEIVTEWRDLPKLYFTLPRSAVLADDVRPDDLQADAWETPGS